jgi:hypothetical protein
MKRTLSIPLIALCLCLCGCAAEQVAQTRTALGETIVAIDQSITLAEQDGDLKAVERLRKAREIAVKGTEAIDAAINPETGEFDPSGAIIGGISSVAGPYAPLVVLFGGIGVAVWRQLAASKMAKQAAEANAAAKSIVNATDALRIASPEVKAAMAANKDVINAALTPAAMAIIADERLT